MSAPSLTCDEVAEVYESSINWFGQHPVRLILPPTHGEA